MAPAFPAMTWALSTGKVMVRVLEFHSTPNRVITCVEISNDFFKFTMEPSSVSVNFNIISDFYTSANALGHCQSLVPLNRSGTSQSQELTLYLFDALPHGRHSHYYHHIARIWAGRPHKYAHAFGTFSAFLYVR